MKTKINRAVDTPTPLSVKKENTRLTEAEERNIFSAALVEFVGRILIEKIFFNQLHIPQDLLLSLVNTLIQNISPAQKTKLDVYKEGVILYKQWMGMSLTPEEQSYDKAMKELDVLAEILNGMQYSALALMGSHLYTSLSSVIHQGLWSHIPALIGYSSALVFGPKAIHSAVEKILAYTDLTQKQKKELTPWLNTIGHLALGFLPKVSADEKGVYYHYPSFAGHRKTVTSEGSTTLAGHHLILERQGAIPTLEGDVEAHYEVQFKLHRIYEMAEEKIKLQIIDQEGKKIPVVFQVNQGESGKEITVKSSDKLLEKLCGNYFQTQFAQMPNITESKADTAQITQLQLTQSSLHSRSPDFTCQSALVLSTVASALGQNTLPVVLAALSCIPKVAAAINESEQWVQSNPDSINVVNLPLDNQLQDIILQNNSAYTVNGAEGLKILDISNTTHVTLVSQYNTPGNATRIVYDNKYVFIADEGSGLQIVNVHNISNPVFAGVWMTGNPVADVAILNGKAYIADGTDTLTEIDINVPENIYQAIVKTTYAQGIAVSGNTAYVADQIAGLRIIDMSDVSNPQLKGTLATTNAYGVAVAGNMTYVADQTSGLRIVDVSDMSNPQLKSTLATTNAYGVAVSGNRAYVADLSSGLRIIDVSDATNPQLISTLPTTYAQAVAVSENRAYVADLSSGLRIIDVSNATNPQLLSTLPTTTALGVAVSGNMAYVADLSSGLRIIDVSNATNPQLKGTLATANAYNVAVSGNWAYVADWSAGLRIIDVSNATNPKLIATQETANAHAVEVSGDRVYVAATHSGLRIMNPLVSKNIYFFRDKIRQLSKVGNELLVLQESGFQRFNPAVPIASTHFQMTQTTDAYAVTLSAEMAHVVGSSGLRIIDVRNLTHPQLIAMLPTTNAKDIAISGDMAYVADSNSGLRIIDVRNVTHPQSIATLATINAKAVVVSEDRVYLADQISGLHIIDVSNVTNPQLISTLATTNAKGIAVFDNRVYVADNESGLRIIDVSNATNPELKGTLATTAALGVAVSGNWAYVADSNSGLRIIDVSNATNPKLASMLATTFAQEVVVSGNKAYVADLSSGLRIIDVSNATNPLMTATLTTAGDPQGLAVVGNTVYVATTAGLNIIDLTNLPMKWMPFTYFPSPHTFLANESYAFISNDNGLSIFNMSHPIEIQSLGSWNTSFPINKMQVTGNQLWLGYSGGALVLNITDPTQPTLIMQYNCSSSVNSFAIHDNNLYLPSVYPCQFPISPSLITFCGNGQLLMIQNNDIQMSKGQNLRLTPNDLSVSCGNNTTPILEAAFNITSIHYAQLETRNSSGFWNSASSFLGTDLSRGDVALVHDNSTNAPAFNFTVNHNQITLAETAANIRFILAQNRLLVNDINLIIQSNGTTILNPSQFQIIDTGTKLDNLVVSVHRVQGGYFSLVNSSTPITDFTFYQLQKGQIQFVHDGISLPSIVLSIANGSGLSVLFSPSVKFFNAGQQPDSKPLPVEILAGVAGGVVATAAIGGALFFKLKFKPEQKEKLERYEEQRERVRRIGLDFPDSANPHNIL